MTRGLNLLAVAACVSALVTPPPAGAGSCVTRSRAVCRPHHAPAVAVETVYAAAFLQVPVPVYPVLGVGYGGDVAAEVKALREELARELARLRQPAAAGPAAPAAPAKHAALAAVVQAKCLRCHGPQRKEGGLDLSDLGAVPAGRRWAAHGLASSGEMPKGGGPVGDDEVRLFYEWAREKR
jgi:mono/diheme cytochrome c family protein